MFLIAFFINHLLFDYFLFLSTRKLIDHVSLNIDTLMLEYGVRFEL